MRRNLAVEDLGDLVELPLVATLATYGRDGSVLLSPVWHEWRDGGFNVATGSAGVKARHLRRDPRASIVVYEHEPPYRGVEVRGRGQLVSERAQEAVLRIAIRYLGESAGTAYAERATDDVLVRIEPGELRAWDFSDEHAP
jgi:PPOX class probable F420-dependent enzyme